MPLRTAMCQVTGPFSASTLVYTLVAAVTQRVYLLAVQQPVRL